MDWNDFMALLPLVVTALFSIIVLLQAALVRNGLASLILTCVGLILGFVSLFFAASVSPWKVSSLLLVDRYALFLMGLFFLAALAVSILAYNYLKLYTDSRSNFFVALLLAVLGSLVLVTGNHFASLFLGLEILTISLYVMIAYLRLTEEPLEAGLKYLILAGASSAFLLFGMALIYAETGTMKFAELAAYLSSEGSLLWLAGAALFIVGVGFKLAVAPFHMWTPDVYHGAPVPATAFVATVSKGAVLGVFLRFLTASGAERSSRVILALWLIAAASMFIGNILALLQNNIKRLLAYSSISHLGYMFVALAAGGNLAFQSILYYLVIYFSSILAAFAVISLVSGPDGEKMAVQDYRGLFWSRPGLAIVLSVALLSLAGIPFTAGFVGKFLIVVAGIGGAFWVLVVILVINSAIGLYYYLRVLTIMYSGPAREELTTAPRLSFGSRIVLAVLTLALVVFGIYPAPLVSLISSIITELSNISI